MSKEASKASIENVYKLEGRVPVAQAIPFGLQHILAMFVSNLAPVSIVCGIAVTAAGTPLTATEIARLLQCAMFASAIGTLIQLYPLFGRRIGSGLPVVMGVSFSFLGTLIAISTNPAWGGYEGMIGAVIAGGIFEGILGLTANYWKKYIKPIVSACVVTAIGISLLSVGMNSVGGGSGVADFGAWYNILVAFITLIACLLFKSKAKGVWSNLNVLFGMAVGYIASLIITLSGAAQMINFDKFANTIAETGIICIPTPAIFLGHTPQFHFGAIVSLAICFVVSAAETIGDTTAVCTGGLGRDITDQEVSGSLAIDGFGSAISGFFGCCPITSFSQNVGLVAMTKVVNRFTIMTGAAIMLAASLFAPIGAFFNSLPSAVLGGCTIMMFGSIVFSGIRMISECGFSQKNMMTVSLAFCIGIGWTLVDPSFFQAFPAIIGDIFASNMIPGVFIVSLLLSLILPEDKEEN